MRKPVQASEIVDKLFQGMGYEDRLQQYRALIIWEQAVGPQIASRTRPIRIRDDILEVNVDQPVWVQQLQLMKPKILAQLNNYLGAKKIRDLYLKLGKVSISPGKALEPVATWKKVQLEEEEKKQVERLLVSLEDNELRAIVEKLLIIQLRLQKATKTHLP